MTYSPKSHDKVLHYILRVMGRAPKMSLKMCFKQKSLFKLYLVFILCVALRLGVITFSFFHMFIEVTEAIWRAQTQLMVMSLVCKTVGCLRAKIWRLLNLRAATSGRYLYLALITCSLFPFHSVALSFVSLLVQPATTTVNYKPKK